MKIYIAGPIAGYPDANRRAFKDAARYLRAIGHTPVNPHDIQPFPHDDFCPPGPMGGEGSEHTAPCFMRTDLIAMLGCDGVYLLEGWEDSSGARIEWLIAAHVCGIPVINPGSSIEPPPQPPASVCTAFGLDF